MACTACVVFNSRESRNADAGAKPRTFGYKAEIPLKDLAPGTYVLRVEATSRVDKPLASFKEVPFEVMEATRSTGF